MKGGRTLTHTLILLCVSYLVSRSCLFSVSRFSTSLPIPETVTFTSLLLTRIHNIRNQSTNPTIDRQNTFVEFLWRHLSDQPRKVPVVWQIMEILYKNKRFNNSMIWLLMDRLFINGVMVTRRLTKGSSLLNTEDILRKHQKKLTPLIIFSLRETEESL